jgi:hypothetical protein
MAILCSLIALAQSKCANENNQLTIERIKELVTLGII